MPPLAYVHWFDHYIYIINFKSDILENHGQD